MRSKNFVRFLFVMAAVAVLVSPARAANPTPPESCSLGNWTVTVDYSGPVDCDAAFNSNAFDENADGECTGVRYSLTGNKPIAQAALLAYNPPYLYDGAYVKAVAGPSSSNVVNDPCVGDSATNTGIGSCHENAIRFNPDDVVDGPFWFVVQGKRQFAATTLALKSNKIDRCEILGVGDLMEENILPDGCVPSCGNFDEDQSIVKTEIIEFDDCKARFEFDLTNGTVFKFGNACNTSLFPDVNYGSCCAEFYPNDGACGASCDFPDYDVDVNQILVDLPSSSGAVPVKFGDGLFTIGGNSCSCRVIGGRVYCWGQVCPE